MPCASINRVLITQPNQVLRACGLQHLALDVGYDYLGTENVLSFLLINHLKKRVHDLDLFFPE